MPEDRAREISTTIRVTNLSEDTSEQDVRDLFLRFGNLQRVYLARNKITQVSRGFAFVSFYNRKDAEQAMDKLQGYGYDNLILRLEFAASSNGPTGGARPPRDRD
jgi:translation initiation factor 3 subunit G